LSTANVGRAALATINFCSGGRPHLGGSRGSHSSIAAQEDAKNIASGADCAAGQAEAQGRPGTGTCVPNRNMRPEWTGYPGQKINHTTINHWVPLWSTNQTWDGKAALYVATKNRGKNRRFGGGTTSQKCRATHPVVCRFPKMVQIFLKLTTC
jgi:hypothetical protein